MSSLPGWVEIICLAYVTVRSFPLKALREQGGPHSTHAESDRQRGPESHRRDTGPAGSSRRPTGAAGPGSRGSRWPLCPPVIEGWAPRHARQYQQAPPRLSDGRAELPGSRLQGSPFRRARLAEVYEAVVDPSDHPMSDCVLLPTAASTTHWALLRSSPPHLSTALRSGKGETVRCRRSGEMMLRCGAARVRESRARCPSVLSRRFVHNIGRGSQGSRRPSCATRRVLGRCSTS